LTKLKKYAERIVEKIHNPRVMLTFDLIVISRNCSFCDKFHVTVEETEGQFVYSIGDHSLDIPAFFLWQGNGFFDILIKAH
jgi:two-component system, chemotaxis family, CheB/CheR fusion protein